MLDHSAKAVVTSYWQAMQSNDFSQAAQWLAEDVVCDWILSRERIIGRANFIAINTHYPAKGKWRFNVRRLLAEGNEVVTDVEVTDGTISAMVITFHTVNNGLITKQIEYWPEHYPAPDWRKQWVEPLNTLTNDEEKRNKNKPSN